MAVLLALLALLAGAERARHSDAGLLAFAETPRRPGNLLLREAVIGRTAEGRPVRLRQLGDPRWSGELLVFGCTHGDECGLGRLQPLTAGCPDPGADIFLAPDLGPETRLAARVISALRPAATIWFHQYPGRRPVIRAWGHDGSSFVVELPQGRLDPRMRERLNTSLLRMGRRVRED